MRLGPWSCTPCRLLPWQVTQLPLKSCWPLAISAASPWACATCGAGVRAVYSNAQDMRPKPSASTPETRRRKRVRGPRGDEVVTSRPRSSADEVDDGEQPDPHHVDEVPVVRHDDRGGGLRGRELAELGPDEKEDERDQPACDMEGVESGRHVEDGAVGAGGDRGLVLGDERVVLVRLAEHEERAHREGEQVPAAQAEHVAALGGEDPELAG